MSGEASIAVVRNRRHPRRRAAGIATLMALLSSVTLASSETAAAAPSIPAVAGSPDYVLQESGGTLLLEYQAATTGVINSIGVSLPTGTSEATAQALRLGNVYGLGPGTLSLNPDVNSDVLTYVVASPVVVKAGDGIAIQVLGIRLPRLLNEFTSTIISTTADGTVVDQGACKLLSATSSSTSSTTVATIDVAQALEITVDNSHFSVDVDPSDPSKSDIVKQNTVSIRTNAGQGYVLSVSDSGLRNKEKSRKPALIRAINLSDDPNNFPDDAFGYLASESSTMSGLTMKVSSGYRGYTSDPTVIAVASHLTGNTPDTITFANRVKVSSNTRAGSYNDTIAYTVSPLY
jgi:hypothetical protein